jgi:F420-dependent oxidoreductase-like protein
MGETVTAPLRYGAFVPQGWKLEYTGWGAADAWDRTKEIAQLTEQLGYHHLWVYDHVETVPRREPTHMFEAYTTLAALSQHTSTIKLGQMVTCAAYRNAGLLAKEAACIDVFSGGRLILGLGAGWYEREYQAYGFPFPRPGVRLQILEETVEVVKRLWTEETVTYQGKHLAFDGAYCDPKPLQRLPELWIGGGGEKVTLRIEARHADKTNWQTGIEGFRRKSQLLHGYCDEIGRDFDTIQRTMGAPLFLAETEADAKAAMELIPADRRWAVRAVTPAQGADVLRPYIDMGFVGFTFGNTSLRDETAIGLAGELLRLVS